MSDKTNASACEMDVKVLYVFTTAGLDKILLILLFAEKSVMRDLLCFSTQYSLDDLRQHVLFFL